MSEAASLITFVIASLFAQAIYTWHLFTSITKRQRDMIRKQSNMIILLAKRLGVSVAEIEKIFADSCDANTPEGDLPDSQVW
jgi:hypothetical protein